VESHVVPVRVASTSADWSDEPRHPPASLRGADRKRERMPMAVVDAA
jgi:hypothetical protein